LKNATNNIKQNEKLKLTASSLGQTHSLQIYWPTSVSISSLLH